MATENGDVQQVITHLEAHLADVLQSLYFCQVCVKELQTQNYPLSITLGHLINRLVEDYLKKYHTMQLVLGDSQRLYQESNHE